MYPFSLKPMIMIQPLRIDERHIALAILRDDLFRASFYLIRQFGEVGTSLRKGNHVTGRECHETFRYRINYRIPYSIRHAIREKKRDSLRPGGHSETGRFSTGKSQQ